MCTQSVGLLAGALEARGIATVCVALLRDVAATMRLPRALAVPFPFGAPLGTSGPAGQHAVLAQALALLGAPGPGPLLADFAPGDPR
ncbi:MAG: hypothetical protein NW201_12940 [Gemmatimonadales bacterium]|nr:hypothetical protein [Gemmatimonadales bacterium]